MSIDWEMNIPWDLIKARLEAAAPIALARAAEHVRGVAVSRTPNETGHLAGSAGVTVHGSGVGTVADVKYPGPYAAYQNRGRRWDGTHIIRNRPAGGQTGFLTDTVVDEQQTVRDIIAQTLRELS